MLETPRRVVLLVEDDAQVRQLLETALDAHGFAVMSAASGESAVAVADADHVDVLVTDIGLPGIDGFQTADRVRLRAPHVHVVFMSGYVGMASTEAASPAVAASVLKKPFKIDVLMDRIREASAPAHSVVDH